MVEYVHFPVGGGFTSQSLTERDAERFIGGRVMSGWDTVQEYVEGPDDMMTTVVWVLSVDGHVWALYVGHSWMV